MNLSKNQEKKKIYDSRRYSQFSESQKIKRRASAAKWQRNNKEKVRAYVKKWTAENKTHVLAYATKRLTVPENRIKHTLGQAKRRAISNNVEFSITIADLLPLPMECPVFGIKLNYAGNKGMRGFIDDSPSIDRIDPNDGYVQGNVRIICWRANRIKSDASIDELKKILRYMQCS